MSINSESDVSANIQIGPTSLGMVRIYIETEAVELPLDFDPEEAEDMAEELRAAAARAREIRQGPAGGPRQRKGGDGNPDSKGGKHRQEGGRGGSKRRAGSGSPS